jgi:sarcosine oxidase subunit gamma
MLDKLCRIDLHPREFHPGACGLTLMAHVSVLIARADQGQPGEAPSFDLIAPSNFAVTVLEAVETAAKEFGYTIGER